ncbi:hypothetical protein CBS101457_006004 [Exobasidium rhododendri]|nr:hypothetical protein CBS101457_006004 [Exobasidium rhododendri]
MMSSSALRSASVQDSKQPEFMKKLIDSPKAMEVITKLMDLLEKKGVDVKGGQPPSMMQMAKIAMDSEIRSATGDVMTALREAGVDVSPEKMQQVLSSQSGFFGKGKEDGDKDGDGEA